MFKGEYYSSYKGYDLGGFIFKGTSFFSSRPTVAGYTLGKINIRAAEGFIAEPGLDGCSNCYQKGAAALVVAISPGQPTSYINANSNYYTDLSVMISAPVYVVSNGSAVYRFSGE